MPASPDPYPHSALPCGDRSDYATDLEYRAASRRSYLAVLKRPCLAHRVPAGVPCLAGRKICGERVADYRRSLLAALPPMPDAEPERHARGPEHRAGYAHTPHTSTTF